MPDVTNIVRIPTFERFFGSNAAQVIVGAATTEIFTIDIGDVETGDVILCNAEIPGIKGLTAGNTFFQFSTSVGSLNFHGFSGFARWQFPGLPASAQWRPLLMAEASSGFAFPVVVSIEGQSAGSNFTIGAGNARGSVLKIRPVI